MSAEAGAAVIGGAIAGVGSAISSGINYYANKELMELDQEFNRTEAEKAAQRQYFMQEDAQDYAHHENFAQRAWQSTENQLNRDWQTNANALAMHFSHEQAIAQRTWEQEMSSTALQRQMADAKAAGINPILLASSLGGASTPQGATASGVAGSPGSGSSGLMGAGSSGSTSARGNGQHVNLNFDSISKFVGNYLSNAREISRKADEFEHDKVMQERRQAHELEMQERQHDHEADLAGGSYFADLRRKHMR